MFSSVKRAVGNFLSSKAPNNSTDYTKQSRRVVDERDISNMVGMNSSDTTTSHSDVAEGGVSKSVVQSVSSRNRFASDREDDYEQPRTRQHKHKTRQHSSGRDKKIRSLEKEKEMMTQEIYKVYQEFDEIKRKNLELETHSAKYAQTIRGLEQTMQDMQELESKLRAQLESTHNHARRLEERSRRESEELRMVQNELRQTVNQHDQTRRLLEERTKELNGAQRFLNQADSLSGADVIGMVESLNAEILQVAAFLAESLDFVHGPPWHERKVGNYDVLSAILGKDLLDALKLSSSRQVSEPDPTPIQNALQVGLIHFCKTISSTWAFDDREERTLTKIYRGICRREQQAVCGRWRSITRAQIKKRDIRERVVTYLMEGVMNVLILSGWLSTSKSGFSTERLSVVADLALRLNTAIGEEITSIDISPSMVLPGDKFDPELMEDTYGDGRKDRDEYMNEIEDWVAGTTDMGLERAVMGSGSRAAVLLKPKVILRSAVQEGFV